MAPDIEQLRQAVTGAQERHAAAVTGLARAEARTAAVTEDLRTEFGIGTLAEAQARIAELQAEVDAEAAAVSAQLEAAR